MPFSSSNTGSTDLRDTEVQQPNTAATLSTDRRPLAFSANSGQLEAGSTTTASSLRPSTPPLAFCWSISISMTSFSVVSLIAMVPDNECRMPTLIGAPADGAGVAAGCASAAVTMVLAAPTAANDMAAAPRPPKPRRVSMVVDDAMRLFPVRSVYGEAVAPRHRNREMQPPCHEFVSRELAKAASGFRGCGLSGHWVPA